jgi:hypothetical protein
MKRQHRFLVLFLLVAGLAACSPGHLGGNEIAFVQNGHLWTIDPDGSNAYEVVAGDTPVIGYAWSPDHQIFVFRQLDSAYAATSAGKHLLVNALTGLPGDVPASLNTVGIDGGVPLPIMPSSSNTLQSNAWWNAQGTRLLYRQELTATKQPIDASWWVSQDDQPDGIARKSLPNSYSIPSFTSDSSLAIGNSAHGAFTTTLAGEQLHLLIPGVLPGHPLAATLERLLWQPAHAQPLLLYAALSTSYSPLAPHIPSTSKGTSTPPIDLLLRNAQGQTSSIAQCACTQFAWSPDGNAILYEAGESGTSDSTYTIYSLSSHASFSFTSEYGGLPYWSPDSRFLLLDGTHSLTLITLANRQQQVLLIDTLVERKKPPAVLPGANAFLQPLSNNIWSADSRRFLLLTRGRLYWNGVKLNGGNGLYTATIDDNGHVQGAPQLIDSGNDSQPGWSYEDPNTSFLF